MNIIQVDIKYTVCGDEKLSELVITIRSNYRLFDEKYKMTSTAKSVGIDDKYLHN
jgi:hypothetical protein